MDPDEFKVMRDRFGDQGIKELVAMDQVSMVLLNRLYLVSSIAANMHLFDEPLAQKFWNDQARQTNHLMEELGKHTVEFQKKHGEI